MERALRAFTEDLARLRPADGDIARLDRYADAAVFHKGLIWALRYETNFTSADVALLRKSLSRGQERVAALKTGSAPWTAKKGKGLRGFISAVDGSIQPYGVVVPTRYDESKPMRLDVVLHGSTKPVGLSELRFAARFDVGDTAVEPLTDEPYIELHPLGRVENCYRWAGETDVFEAIEAVCRNYRIDRDRIVLRGMSMGASGAWHLGLKHPDRFVALGPYCGYVDTHRFSETPVPNFVKVGPLPWYQERGLHFLDSVDYAANAGVVPAIAAMGDQDVFFQAHVLMAEAMAKEGLQMVNLISPGTGHVLDPVTHREQLRRIDDYASKGLDPARREIRFVTWTLKYNRCFWVELLGLKKHGARAEFAAKVNDDGSVDVSIAENITDFALHPPVLRRPGATLRIAGQNITLPQRKNPWHRFVLRAGRWDWAGDVQLSSTTGKRPGLTGPIDDAFTAPFLCVRGTDTPWNPAVGAWADANLSRFAYEWARYMRGDLPVKADTDVTESDLRTKHLILFGDPGSNRWIRKALPRLPVSWSRSALRLGRERYSAKDHAPVFICPSPLSEGQTRYLVLNSGHTFHESEFSTLNYLLFPRHGDWAVMKLPSSAEPWQPSRALPENVVNAGFFNEAWR